MRKVQLVYSGTKFSYFSDWSKFYGKMLDSLESCRGFCTILFSASTSSSRLPWTGPSPSAPGHRLLSRPDVSVAWKHRNLWCNATMTTRCSLNLIRHCLDRPDSLSPENQYRNPWWNVMLKHQSSKFNVSMLLMDLYSWCLPPPGTPDQAVWETKYTRLFSLFHLNSKHVPPWPIEE